MKIIAKGRGKGKTTELIKMSAEKQIPIVCKAGLEGYIEDISTKMNVKIPKPIPIDLKNIRGYKGKVLIDNADDILNYILKDMNIDTITISSDGKNELETDEKTTYSDEVIKKLKSNVKKISDQLDKCTDYNKYIAGLKAIEKSMEIIHNFDWKDSYSKYHTGADNHLEVATWKQNSDGDIKDYHHYEVNNESSDKEIKEFEKAVNDMGISTRINNVTRPMNDILNDIARVWKNFDDDFQKDFSHMFAGTRMKNTISALMDHYDLL